jgi:copper chaperone CopZ
VPINKVVNFTVNGMHCGGCADKIKRSVGDLHIEHSLKIDVPTGAVKIAFDSAETSIAKLKNCITQVGFQVEKVELE